MKKLLLLTMTAVQLICFQAWAGDGNISLKNKHTPFPDKSKEFSAPTIPVQASIHRSLLSIYFENAKQVFVTVYGPDGVVYQRKVATDTSKSIYVDLAKYREGQYTIHFLDARGNELSGESFCKKERNRLLSSYM